MIRKTLLVLSLVLLVSAIVFWVRGYSRYECLLYERPFGGGWSVESHYGTIGLNILWIDDWPGRIAGGRLHLKSVPTGAYWAPWRGVEGFAANIGQIYRWFWFYWRGPRIILEPGTHVIVRFPNWFVVLVTGAYPAVVFTRYRRRPFARSGCRTCHYDLTGNESGVCPECGEAI